MKKCLTVFESNLATILINKGYKVQGVAPDNNYPNRVVYFFLNTPEIKQAIKEYANERSTLECVNNDKKEPKRNL